MTYDRLHDKNGERILDIDGKQIWVIGEPSERSFSLWSHTITVYNKKIDAKNKCVKWYMTVLENCFYATNIDAQKRGGGFQAYSSDERAQHEVPKVIVRIPYQRKYKPPKEWELYPDGFTLKPDDLIFLGTVYETISDEKGHRVNDILDRYGLNAMVVKVVRDNIHKSDYIKHIHAEGY